MNINNNDTNNDEAGPSNTGIALPHTLAMKSIEDNLITPLRPILKNKDQATQKCDFLRSCVACNLLPKGVLPKVPLKIKEPPLALKEQWEVTLTECGNKLLRILIIDFHKSQIMELDQLAQNSIMRASHVTIPEF